MVPGDSKSTPETQNGAPGTPNVDSKQGTCQGQARIAWCDLIGLTRFNVGYKSLQDSNPIV